ncbi:error-prone DNA polymerase [Novosphingobium sp. KA1]|uniref:error-prone DNA polymerase n=1 Tax=Novosphingobium sp. (strain KA1) TaxID=164608 RepID=UPI001A8ED381|nr:error-prone DNA polymerase [Novosphingobium sp. KA1]QSR19685.1 error-prone DNA polymerase [Novosphingobium sp. KA1]
MRYAELQCASHFSFLRGASSCEELFTTAAAHGLEALAITDRNSLAGIVRAYDAARSTGVRLIVGCRLDLIEGYSLLVYPMNRTGYARLCRLLSRGRQRGGKGKCLIGWDDVADHAEGLLAILLPGEIEEADPVIARFERIFSGRCYLALTLHRRPGDQMRLHMLSNLAARHQVATVVTGDVLYHHPHRRVLQEVMTCIRHRCTIDELGARREINADRFLMSPAEMYRLHGRYEAALERTIEIAGRCRFSLDELRYQYPEEAAIPGLTSQQVLERLTWEAAGERYPEGLPNEVARLLRHELSLIGELGYAPYFLTVNSIVRFARSREILCQGRGSAANSAVCYVLGITSIDPARSDLLFERFISQERREPPDIDVDFEHERREIVMQWVFETYGRNHAALCSTVIRYRAKGAIRDVGKALGLSEDLIKSLSGQMWGWSEDGVEDRHVKELNLNLGDRRLRLAIDLARELIGTPRHLSQHPGGFVLTHDRLDELVPIEPAAMPDRQVIEWDKDDIDILKFMKVDCLALGMLTAMKRGFNFLSQHKGIEMDLSSIPPEDPRTYAMIRAADTLGAFQIESRAQMAMLPHIKPRTFYDLVIEVAIVRPGPIQGDMVHPYLRRRAGKEPVHYPKPELEKVLGKTLGVPLFQEQAMRVAIECAGFTPTEADQLRRAMATFKFTGGVSKFKEKLVAGMTERGYTAEFAEKTFGQLEGFGSYGFPESHAASFALIAYASCWLKCWHPDVFCASLLNAQPMGFYAPAQIVADAKAHGVEVRPVCVNASRWDCTLEPTASSGEDDRFAVRLGMRMVKGLAEADVARIVAARADQPYTSVEELWRRADVPATALGKLAEADAFRASLRLARREALWAIKALRDEQLPLFAAAEARGDGFIHEIVEQPVLLRAMTEGREVVEDYSQVGLTLRRHPVAFLRHDLDARKIAPCRSLETIRDGRRISLAGLVLVRQRPGSAKGVLFITIEDETGIANLIVWPRMFEENRRIVMGARMLGVEGVVQREGEVIHVIARKLTDLTPLLSGVGRERGGTHDAFPLPFGRGDGAKNGGGPDPRDPVEKHPAARNILIPLCRTRHKGSYAEPEVMPNPLQKSRDFR